MAKLRTASILAVLVCLAAPAAYAQPECPCNCYFSGDCEPGNFCNWGSIPQEDSCFWRLPKPQGAIGAGCDQEYNDWGQCDGICTPTASASYYSLEAVGDLVRGVQHWSDAMTHAAVNGGGVPHADLVAAVMDIPFKHKTMADSLWRIAVEVHGLTRGEILIYPEHVQEFHSEQVAIADLSGRPDLVEIGNLGIEALVAEMKQVGAGRAVIDRIGGLGLDALLPPELYARLCHGEREPLNCLYTRIADMADALARGGRDPEGLALGGPDCNEEPPPCDGDADKDGTVNVDDLVMVIVEWSDHVFPGSAGDVNEDGAVNVDDLVMVIQNWGDCPASAGGGES